MSQNFLIPKNVKENILALYADVGQQWLENFPAFIAQYEKQWNFKAIRCFDEAQFNVVLEAERQNKLAVFKCSVPNKEFKTEVLALSFYNGIGAVALLEKDVENCAMLLEKINPGDILEKCTSIEMATREAISVCKKLHKPIQDISPFPTLENWLEGLHRASDQLINKKLLDQAKSLSMDLLVSQKNRVLLHGDLHYANLLRQHDHYIAIDPKGVIGEPEFEIPLPRVNSGIHQKKLSHHVDCFIELSGFDKKRIYQWVFIKSVLAACWTVEDGGATSSFTQQFLNAAEMVQKFL